VIGVDNDGPVAAKAVNTISYAFGSPISSLVSPDGTLYQQTIPNFSATSGFFPASIDDNFDLIIGTRTGYPITANIGNTVSVIGPDPGSGFPPIQVSGPDRLSSRPVQTNITNTLDIIIPNPLPVTFPSPVVYVGNSSLHVKVDSVNPITQLGEYIATGISPFKNPTDYIFATAFQTP
jgi:hypothetical protein